MSQPAPASVECFFDVSSPWTYLAFHNLRIMAEDIKATVIWKPILVGGVFNSVNLSVYASRDNPVPAKRDYMMKDLQDWARAAGLVINFPPSVFPVNSVKAMRACLVAQQRGLLLPFARALFEAYWVRGQDISQEAVLAAICRAMGVDATELLAASSSVAIKQQLKDNTDELVARGGFGSPTLFVGGADMYFGNDRLPLVKAALLRSFDAKNYSKQ